MDPKEKETLNEEQLNTEETTDCTDAPQEEAAATDTNPNQDEETPVLSVEEELARQLEEANATIEEQKDKGKEIVTNMELNPCGTLGLDTALVGLELGPVVALGADERRAEDAHHREAGRQDEHHEDRHVGVEHVLLLSSRDRGPEITEIGRCHSSRGRSGRVARAGPQRACPSGRRCQPHRPRARR